MCVVNHLGIPCSKCGSPKFWRREQKRLTEGFEAAAGRLMNLAEYVEDLPDDCPIKSDLKAILQIEGGSGG